MEWVIAGILILLLILIGLILKKVSTIISKIEPPVADKLAKNTENIEILQYLDPIPDNKEILDKINKLAARGASSPSLLKLTASILPQYLINSAAYLNMGQLYRLGNKVIGTQMNYGSGIGSPVIGDNGKLLGHNSFMPLGIPWVLFLYQAGSIIFSVAHLAKISQFLEQINKKLEDLSYRFNFRSYSSSYGNYLLLQEISGYLQECRTITDIHRTQLALIGKDLAADKIYYSQMVSRIDGIIKNKKGASLRKYVEAQSETLCMDVHGLYITYYSSILYALLIGSEDAPQRVDEYNQAAAPYAALKEYILGNDFENFFLSDQWWNKPAGLVATGWAILWGRDTPRKQRKAYLQNFQESLPDMPPITKKIPSKPEIYVVRNDKDFLVYTPMD